MSASQWYVDALNVQVYDSGVELTQEAVFLTETYLHSCLKTQDTARIILATGNSQIEFLKTLTALDSIDWSRLICFHLDEYLGITAEHPGSFRNYLQHRVEQRINSGKFHYLQGDALQPLRECRRYRQLLQEQSIDLCFLGIGDNGHLAFNEPSVADFTDPDWVKIVKLEPKTRQQQVDSGYFTSLDAVPQYAYTLTIPTICRAKGIICLVQGKHKREIIKQTLQGKITPSCPASILRQQSQATLLLDRDAATDLNFSAQVRRISNK
jgi:glucosamine-6-phosphate deaminase